MLGDSVWGALQVGLVGVVDSSVSVAVILPRKLHSHREDSALVMLGLGVDEDAHVLLLA